MFISTLEKSENADKILALYEYLKKCCRENNPAYMNCIGCKESMSIGYIGVDFSLCEYDEKQQDCFSLCCSGFYDWIQTNYAEEYDQLMQCYFSNR